MNKNLLLIALGAVLMVSSCTKETTKTVKETVTVTVKEEYNPAKPGFIGTWKQVNTNPSDTSKTYWVFGEVQGYAAYLYQTTTGLRQRSYSALRGDSATIQFNNSNMQVYVISGDTMRIYNNPTSIAYTMVKDTSNTVTVANWISKLNLLRSILAPVGSAPTSSSFGIEGDFLHTMNRPTGVYRFYKINSITGERVDSANALISTWHAMYYRNGTNKLYHTRYSGTSTLRYRSGLSGSDANLSTNSLSNIRAISMNPSSGTVYAYRSGTLYSGTEGASFSSLHTFTGTAPQVCIYYKNDQFLGVYNGSLIMFKIAPSYEILKHYGLENHYIYTVSSNGSDVWVFAWNGKLGKYEYVKVQLN